MKPIKISLNLDASDCYVYDRFLFLILKDGRLAYLSIPKIIQKIKAAFPDYHEFLNLMFFRNDNLTNEQAERYLKIKDIDNIFLKIYKYFSNKQDIVLNVYNDLITLDNIKDLPIVDLNIYGRKLYAANKKGLYEMKFSIPSAKNDELHHDKLSRIFDSRSSSVNIRYGAIALSSISDGLFQGKFNELDRSILRERPIRNKSVKTSWSQIDLVNYTNNLNIDYLINKPSILKNGNFKGNESKVVDEIGIDAINLYDRMQSYDKIINDLTFIYNFNTKFYFINSNGNIRKISIGRNIDYSNNANKINNNINISNKIYDITKKKKIAKKKPLSLTSILDGLLIEYFDSVYLFYNDEYHKIEDSPSYTIRSYPFSIRYKNIFTIAKGDKLNIYSILPKILTAEKTK